MKYPLWGVILFIIVVVLLVLRTIHSSDMMYEGFTSEGFDETSHPSEGFASEEEDKCQHYSSCSTCTNASGCAWCPATNQCLNNNTLHISTGVRGGNALPQCNQNNSIFTSMHCESNPPVTPPPDFTLRKSVIEDKPKPPNVGLEYAI